MTKNKELVEKIEEPIEKMLLDTKMNKYKLSNLLSKKVEELRKKDEFKGLVHFELLKLATKEIIEEYEKSEKKV